MPTAKKSSKTAAKKPVKVADMKPAKDAKGGKAGGQNLNYGGRRQTF
ncbi:MAG: hypothetical protein ACR2NX_06890 [Chthoniobacterales bacterium]